MAKIAFLGLGAMGIRMARHLLDAGHDLTVWNRTASLADPLVEAGAKLAATPRDAAKGAELTISMVRDDDVSEKVWFDPETGAAAGLEKGALAMESSTVTPDHIKSWAEKIRAAGGRPVEGPVSGSRPQADGGTLVFLMGGEAADVDAARPMIEPMGKGFYHQGPIGAGAVVKLVTNTLMAVQVGAWSELLPLMQRQNINLDNALEALSTTVVWAPMSAVQTKLMREGQHAPQFPIELIGKDMGYVTRIGQEGDLPLAELMRDRFNEAIEKGLGNENMSALVKLRQDAEQDA